MAAAKTEEAKDIVVGFSSPSLLVADEEPCHTCLIISLTYFSQLYGA